MKADKPPRDLHLKPHHYGRNNIIIETKATKGSWSTSIAKDGSFHRKESQFRNKMSEGSVFTAESGRYHLYWSAACPWAHRTVIYRELKGLTGAIGLTEVDYLLDGKTGWRFPEGENEPNNDFWRLRQIYEQSDPQY